MMQNICPREKCTGCTACMNVCPYNAITMYPDACGFLHPVISQDTCVDCGLCVKTCPVNSPLILNHPQLCYAAKLKAEKELLSCSSGGVATAISHHVISQGGVVYGCSGKDARDVHHIRVDTNDGLEDLKGSKYVQSCLGETFRHIKEDLNSFPIVLFTGTPCQVAGLRKFLRKDCQNLFTIDLVCHGVPSQKMLNDNLKTYCSDEVVPEVIFRQKNKTHVGTGIEYGWKVLSPREGFFYPYNKDYYVFGFLKGLTLRESCYTCSYARNERVADLTLGDFWGLQPDAGFVFGKGVSVVFINTEKGKELFEGAKEGLDWKQRTVEEATRWNGHLNQASEKPVNYEFFRKAYANGSFPKAMRRAYYQTYFFDYYIKCKNRLRRLLYRVK